MGQFGGMEHGPSEMFKGLEAEADAVFAKKHAREASERGDTSKTENLKEKGANDQFAEMEAELAEKRKATLKESADKSKKAQEDGTNFIKKQPNLLKQKIASLPLRNAQEKKQAPKLPKNIDINDLLSKLPKTVKAEHKNKNLATARIIAESKVRSAIKYKIVQALGMPIENVKYKMNDRNLQIQYEKTDDGAGQIAKANISQKEWENYIKDFIKSNSAH